MADGINLKMRMSGDEKVRRDLKKTGNSAKSMGKSMGMAGKGTAALAAGLVATTAAAVATIRATLNLANQLDEIAKKSRSIGASAEDLQLLQGAFELNGVEADQLFKSMQKLNQGMGEAMKGTASYTDAFAALNLTAEELEQMPLRERMLQIAEGMERLGSKARQAQVASLLFGRSGKDMLVAFEEGADSLSEAIDDIARFGVASSKAVKQAEDMNDAITRMNKAFFGFKVEALEPIMPVIEDVANEMAELMAEFRETGDAEQFGRTIVEVMLGAVAPAAVAGVSGITKALAALPSAFAGAELVFARFEQAVRGIFDIAKAGSTFNIVDSAIKLLSGRGMEIFSDATLAVTSEVGAAQSEFDEAIRNLGASQEAIDNMAEKTMKSLEKLQKKYREGAGGAVETGVPDPVSGGGGGGGGGGGEDPRTERDREHFETLADMRITDSELAKKLIEEEAAMRDQFLVDQQNAAMAVLDATGSFAASISQMISATMGENSEEAKKAARVLFGVQQATALASATVAMAQAIAQANAAAPPPFNVPGIIQASVTGAAQIAAITAATISGVADAGLPPGALRAAGLNQHTVLAVRNDEMVLDPVGTAAISRMLEQRATGQGQPIMVNASVEIDGEVLGRSVDNHLVRSSERGLGYERRIRY